MKAVVCYLESKVKRDLLDEGTWDVLGASDVRRPPHERMLLAARVKNRRPCCHTCGMDGEVHLDDSTEVGDLVYGEFARVANTLAHLILTSLASVERLHARSRQSASQQMCIANLNCSTSRTDPNGFWLGVLANPPQPAHDLDLGFIYLIPSVYPSAPRTPSPKTPCLDFG